MQRLSGSQACFGGFHGLSAFGDFKGFYGALRDEDREGAHFC